MCKPKRTKRTNNKKTMTADEQNNFEKILMLILSIAIIMTVALMMSGCKQTEYVTVPEYHTDTLIQTNVQKDSIYLHDSIHIKEKGDTVWIERWHTRWENHLVHDTTYISRVDSVPVPYPVEVIKEVEKPLTWWQKTKMKAGLVLIVGIGLISLIGLIKLLRKFGIV